MVGRRASTQLRDRAEPAAGVGEEDPPDGPAPGPKAAGTAGSISPQRLGPLRRTHHVVKEIEPWGVLLAAGALVLSIVAFWIDYSDLVEERSVRAWQLLTTKAPGNSGKIAALEYLNNEGAPLVGIDLSRLSQGSVSVFLQKVKLAHADLSEANLSEANLVGANLSSAVLFRANLSGANLTQADLTLADLASANLSNADLRYADLSKAAVNEADLTSDTQLCQPEQCTIKPCESDRRLAHRR